MLNRRLIATRDRLEPRHSSLAAGRMGLLYKSDRIANAYVTRDSSFRLEGEC
jgi:hypothetical protein